MKKYNCPLPVPTMHELAAYFDESLTGTIDYRKVATVLNGLVRPLDPEARFS